MVDTLRIKKEENRAGGENIFADTPSSRQESQLADAKPKLLEAYATRKHGEMFSGMYFDGSDGKPEWGTYGLERTLPAGVDASEVEVFLVQDEYLELVKRLSPDLPDAQKANMQHIPGWRRKVKALEGAVAESPQSATPLAEGRSASTGPDFRDSSSTLPTEAVDTQGLAGSNKPAAAEVLKAGPGMDIESLKKIISGNTGHVEASALAEQLHKQARE